MKKTINWSAVYSWDPKYSSGEGVACYEKCDGYCCTPFFGDELKLINAEPVLPMLESEYEYLLSIGGLAGVTDNVKSEVYEPVEGAEVRVYYAKCSCRGLCSPHEFRPFICQVYPFFPLIDAEGEIEGFEIASLLDMFHKNENPCYLAEKKSIKVQERVRKHLQPLIRGNPEMIFLLRAVRTITEFMKRALKETVEIRNTKNRRKFLSSFERKVFMREPWRNEEFLKRIASEYMNAFNE
ncbi:hypothetical protein [Desulfobacter latus]|uniref:Uncharacterized protein n=1 Tax=Desulfobacter latus TaxID=2292 RepID=A0A850T9S2_9BACT|nr:hypothetical protein [Desulfobacter latus]NWH04957.1 hypothetical protein [Desulfobacter latus]